MNKKIVISAALLAILAIIFGAFGAHGLKELINVDSLVTFEVGVRYQMYHAIALLVIGLNTFLNEKTRKWVFIFFVLGILLFSGSIYALSLKEIIPFPVLKIAFLTPIGGFSFLIGWVIFIVGIIKLK